MLAAVVLVLTALVTTSSQTAVTVSVFYESMCEDSVRFLVDQLYPTYLQLDTNIPNIDFVPYGKATHSVRKDGIDIACHFGPMACRANTIQACGLALLTGQPRKQVEFVVCVMNSTKPQAAEKECASRVDMDLTPLVACTNSTNGKVLQASHGFRTHALMPNIAFVPSIMYNGEFNQENQDGSLLDFESMLCSHMTEEDRVGCSSLAGATTSTVAASVLALTAALISIAVNNNR